MRNKQSILCFPRNPLGFPQKLFRCASVRASTVTSLIVTETRCLSLMNHVMSGASMMSPVVKSLVGDNEPSAIEYRGRSAIMQRIDTRFRFLAVSFPLISTFYSQQVLAELSSLRLRTTPHTPCATCLNLCAASLQATVVLRWQICTAGTLSSAELSRSCMLSFTKNDRSATIRTFKMTRLLLKHFYPVSSCLKLPFAPDRAICINQPQISKFGWMARRKTPILLNCRRMHFPLSRANDPPTERL